MSVKRVAYFFFLQSKRANEGGL